MKKIPPFARRLAGFIGGGAALLNTACADAPRVDEVAKGRLNREVTARIACTPGNAEALEQAVNALDGELQTAERAHREAAEAVEAKGKAIFGKNAAEKAFDAARATLEAAKALYTMAESARAVVGRCDDRPTQRAPALDSPLQHDSLRGMALLLAKRERSLQAGEAALEGARALYKDLDAAIARGVKSAARWDEAIDPYIAALQALQDERAGEIAALDGALRASQRTFAEGVERYVGARFATERAALQEDRARVQRHLEPVADLVEMLGISRRTDAVFDFAAPDDGRFSQLPLLAMLDALATLDEVVPAHRNTLSEAERHQTMLWEALRDRRLGGPPPESGPRPSSPDELDAWRRAKAQDSAWYEDMERLERRHEVAFAEMDALRSGLHRLLANVDRYVAQLEMKAATVRAKAVETRRALWLDVDIRRLAGDKVVPRRSDWKIERSAQHGPSFREDSALERTMREVSQVRANVLGLQEDIDRTRAMLSEVDAKLRRRLAEQRVHARQEIRAVGAEADASRL